METEVVSIVARYVEEALGKEGFRYVCAVVANCKMLALELEAQVDEVKSPEEIDTEALILAGYLHDISTIEHGFHDHHIKSAAMAVDVLCKLEMPAERISNVEQAILVHTTALSPGQRSSTSIEGRILYDADKLGRMLAAILRHIEERFVELYQSLNTAPAREMAREKFGNTLSFLDGVIEHLSDATPV